MTPSLLDWLESTHAARNYRQPPDTASVRIARQGVVDAAADNLDGLIDAGLVSIDPSDTEPIEQLQVTAAEWDFIRMVLLHEAFKPRPRPAKATVSAPGSPERVEEMAARQTRGESVFHPEDATADGRKLKARRRMNGAADYFGDKLQVIGWADEGGDAGE